MAMGPVARSAAVLLLRSRLAVSCGVALAAFLLGACTSASQTHQPLEAKSNTTSTTIPGDGIRREVAHVLVTSVSGRRTILTGSATVKGNVRALVGAQIRCSQQSSGPTLVSSYTTSNSVASGSPITLTTRWL